MKIPLPPRPRSRCRLLSSLSPLPSLLSRAECGLRESEKAEYPLNFADSDRVVNQADSFDRKQSSRSVTSRLMMMMMLLVGLARHSEAEGLTKSLLQLELDLSR